MIHAVFTLLLTLVLVSGNLMAQDSAYQLPPQSVVDIIDAKPDPAISFSPDHQWMLMIERESMPDISDVARRMLGLAGVRIDPVINGRFATSFFAGLALGKRGTDSNRELTTIPLAPGAKLIGISWSHDSKHFAYRLATSTGQELWVCPVAEPAKPRMLTDRLNTVMSQTDWMPDGDAILCQLVPENRTEEPVDDKTPTGPNVQESYGNKSPTRTFQDLLENAHDEALFTHFATGQIAILGLDGSVRKIGSPGIYSRVSPSPSGDFVLLTEIKKPFSYLMTYYSFPRNIEIRKLNDSAAGPQTHTFAQIPLDENIPIEGVRVGPRRVDWKTGAPASLVWHEALDGGDPNQEAEHRDRYMQQSAPFNEAAQEVVRVKHRAVGTAYFEDPSLLLTTEYDRDRRWVVSLLHDLDSGDQPKTLTDRSTRDRYGDPGAIVSRQDETGHSIARQDGDWIYRKGNGASPEGNLPFIDRQNLKTLETERLWQCESGNYEAVVRIASSNEQGKLELITNHENLTTPANYFLRNLSEDSVSELTQFKDPTPQIQGIKKQLQRRDATAVACVGLPERVQRRQNGWASFRQPQSIHAHARVDSLGFVNPRLRDHGRGNHAGHWRPGNDERYVYRTNSQRR